MIYLIVMIFNSHYNEDILCLFKTLIMAYNPRSDLLMDYSKKKFKLVHVDVLDHDVVLGVLGHHLEVLYSEENDFIVLTIKK